MQICKITLEGYRAFRNTVELECGGITTFVGKNDVGKSSVLHALEMFFNKYPEESDFNRDQGSNDPMIVELSFDRLPQTIELEAGVDTTFADENLLGESKCFVVRKTYLRSNPKKPKITFKTIDFVEKRFQNICSLPEKELNDLGKSLGLDFKQSGAGITNKGKRGQIREYLRENNESEGVAANRHPGQVGYSHSPLQEVRDEESSLRADPGKEGKGQVAHAAACAALERQRQSDLPVFWSLAGALLYLEAAL